VLIGSRGV
jgi:hypothetical protein